MAILQANGGNELRTAEELGINRHTLRGWAGKTPDAPGTHSFRAPAHADPALVSQFSERIAERLDGIVERTLERWSEAIDRVEIKTAKDVRDIAVSAGISIEKQSFARGGPTQRVASLHALLVGVVQSHDKQGTEP